jgi:hypothetical protein
MTGEPAWALWTIAAAVVVAAALVWWVWHKGRPFSSGDVFRASRLSAGNRLFPTQVLITPTSVVQYTPRWIGRREETIHMAHIASVRIETGALLSNIIETSGGATHPLPRARQADATAIKARSSATRPTTTASGPGRRPVGPAARADKPIANNGRFDLQRPARARRRGHPPRPGQPSRRTPDAPHLCNRPSGRGSSAT